MMNKQQQIDYTYSIYNKKLEDLKKKYENDILELELEKESKIDTIENEKYHQLEQLVEDVVSIAHPCSKLEDNSHLEYCGVCQFHTYDEVYDKIRNIIYKSPVVEEYIIRYNIDF